MIDLYAAQHGGYEVCVPHPTFAYMVHNFVGLIQLERNEGGAGAANREEVMAEVEGRGTMMIPSLSKRVRPTAMESSKLLRVRQQGGGEAVMVATVGASGTTRAGVQSSAGTTVAKRCAGAVGLKTNPFYPLSFDDESEDEEEAGFTDGTALQYTPPPLPPPRVRLATTLAISHTHYLFPLPLGSVCGRLSRLAVNRPPLPPLYLYFRQLNTNKASFQANADTPPGKLVYPTYLLQ